MARKPTTRTPTDSAWESAVEQAAADVSPYTLINERVAELENKVQVLWDMVVFLRENPHYRPGDYLMERGL